MEAVLNIDRRHPPAGAEPPISDQPWLSDRSCWRRLSGEAATHPDPTRRDAAIARLRQVVTREKSLAETRYELTLLSVASGIFDFLETLHRKRPRKSPSTMKNDARAVTHQRGSSANRPGGFDR